MKTLNIWLAALTLAALPIACGGEDTSGGDDDDEGNPTSGNTTSASTTTGGANAADCPGARPGDASACTGVGVGLACSYGNVVCTCSGTTWNCRSGGGDNNDSGGDSSSSTTGSGPFGGDGGGNDSSTTGFNTDCEGVTPQSGAECSETGTVCGLESDSDQVCVCFGFGSNTPTWTCATDAIGGVGFGGSNGSGGTSSSDTTGFNTDCEGVTPENGAACTASGTVCGLGSGSDEVCLCIAAGSDTPTWACAGSGFGFGGAPGN